MIAKLSEAGSARGITKSEFARRDGCNEKLVRRAILEGRLETLPGGGLDPALVGSGWRRTNRRAPRSAIGYGAAAPVTYQRRLPEAPGPVVSLSVFPESAAADLAIALLPLLPETEVQAIYDRCLASWRTAAAELADADFAPPAGKASWGSHPLFTNSPNEDWEELKRESGAA